MKTPLPMFRLSRGLAAAILFVSLVPAAFSQGECGRDPDWDWTVDQYYTMYTLTQGTLSGVRLPYFDYLGPASQLNKGSNTDIRPQDGWVLVYRDFGLPQCPARVPFFMLYNIYRGTLRVFYLNTLTSSTYTHAVGYLTQTNSYKAAAFFPYGKTDYFLNSYDAGAVESSIHELGPMQWSYADFNVVGYDDSLAQDTTFNFEFRGVNVSNITLDGGISLEQVLSQDGHVGAKLSFGSAASAIEKGYKWYKTVDNAKNGLKEHRDANPNAWYAGAINTILNSGITGVAGPLAGIAGLVGSFISGSHSKQTLPMKFKGTLELSGDMTNSGLLYTFEIRAPGASLSNPNDSKRPEYHQPLGIYNIVSKPSFIRDLDLVCYLAEEGGDHDGGGGFTRAYDHEDLLWDWYGPEMLAIKEGYLDLEEETAIMAFIYHDLEAQFAAGLIPGGGGGGGTCGAEVSYKLAAPLQYIVNPVLSGKVSCTMGLVRADKTTTYTYPSSLYNYKTTFYEPAFPTTWAFRVRVNTGVSGAAYVYLLNTYDGTFYAGNL